MQNNVFKDILKSIIMVAIGLILFVVAITSIPNIYIAQDNDWIGFYGAVIGSLLGGYITFLGIQITINYNEKERTKNKDEEKEGKRKEILPHITAEFEYFDRLRGTNGIIDHRLWLRLRNIGKDNCINLLVTLIFENHDISIGSTPIEILQKNSLVKNEYSNKNLVLVNPENRNLTSIELEFYDLELRMYSQVIDIKMFYPSEDEMLNDSKSHRSFFAHVESKIPKLYQ